MNLSYHLAILAYFSKAPYITYVIYGARNFGEKTSYTIIQFNYGP